MVKTLAAVSVLAIAGSAVAAPYSVAGAQIGASNVAPDAGISLNFSLSSGVVPFNPNPGTFNGAFGLADHPLVGAHGGTIPAGGQAFDSALAAPLVASSDPWDGTGDTSYNVGFTIPSAASHVGSALGPFGENDVWIGRASGTSALEVLQVIFSSDVGANLDFVLDGAGVSVDGQTLFAKSIATEGSNNGSFDIYITDAPAPGAAALLGLAGIAGLRRRRA